MSSAETKTEPAPASAPGPSGGGGGSKLVPILTLVNLVASLAMVAVLFISFQRDKKKPSVEDISIESHGGGEHAAAGGEHGGEHGGGGHGGGHGEKGAPSKKAGDFGNMVTLDLFTVNLSTPGSSTPKFVRVAVSLEVPTDEAVGEVNQKMPQVRNAIIDLFNSKRPTDLASTEGRDFIKEEIRNALNSFMVSGKVKSVFFTNFAVTS